MYMFRVQALYWTHEGVKCNHVDKLPVAETPGAEFLMCACNSINTT